MDLAFSGITFLAKVIVSFKSPETSRSLLASLGENSALSGEYLVPLAPLRENQVLERMPFGLPLSTELSAFNYDPFLTKTIRFTLNKKIQPPEYFWNFSFCFTFFMDF
jgi:hypothetical protein